MWGLGEALRGPLREYVLRMEPRVKKTSVIRWAVYGRGLLDAHLSYFPLLEHTKDCFPVGFAVKLEQKEWGLGGGIRVEVTM